MAQIRFGDDTFLRIRFFERQAVNPAAIPRWLPSTKID
jgi:hypothetical protein